MRAFSKSLLCASLPLAGILFIACDDMELGDSSPEDEHGLIEFRDNAPINGNSAYAGIWPVSNQTTSFNTPVNGPFGSSTTVKITGGTVEVSGVTKTITSLAVSTEGQIEANYTGGSYDIAGDTNGNGGKLNLTITDGNGNHSAVLWFKSRDDSTGAIDSSVDIYRYTIWTNLDNGNVTNMVGRVPWYNLCPLDADNDEKAVILKATRADVYTTGSEDAVWLNYTSPGFMIACSTHAAAKIIERANANLVPSAYRSLSHADGSSFVQAMQAIFKGPTYTAVGTPIHIKHNVSSGTALINEYVSGDILESTYKADPMHNVAATGAQCKFTSGGYPNGKHRRAAFDPPVTNITGWTNLSACNTGTPTADGPFSIYVTP